MLRALLAGIGAAGCVPVPTGRSDALLIKAEKAANAAGARALGFGDPAPVVAGIRAGAVRALVVLGHDLLLPAFLGGARALAGLDARDPPRHAPLGAASAPPTWCSRRAIPPSARARSPTTPASCSASRRPSSRAFEAFCEGEILAELGAALGLPGFAERGARRPDEAAGQAVD